MNEYIVKLDEMQREFFPENATMVRAIFGTFSAEENGAIVYTAALSYRRGWSIHDPAQDFAKDMEALMSGDIEILR